jgi:hypothetical protein
MCYIHRSFFNGWRLHAACICSVNVIVPPPCSTRPNEQPSAAAASVSTEPCPGSVVGCVREIVFLPFPSNLQSLPRHHPATTTPTRRDTTEHQPFNIQQTLPNSRTLLYRPTSLVPSSCRCRLPSPVVFQGTTPSNSLLYRKNNNLPTHQAFTTHFATAIPQLFTACRSRPRRHQCARVH